MADPVPIELTVPRRKRYGLEWWHVPVFLLVPLQIFLFIVPRTRPGLVGVVCWYLGGDPILWTGFAIFWTLIGLIVCNYRRPFRTPWRIAAFSFLTFLAVAPFAYRTYPSSHDGRPSTVAFRLPLDGPIRVGWGGATPDVNYHVKAPSQRWAYDLLVTDGGKSHRGEGDALTDYYVYDRSILAPADGQVVRVFDRDPDMPIGQLGGGTDAGGNQVVIKVAEGQFLFLCHLKPGSIRVKAGERVARGDEIGRVGNSGNTSEPHLHIHLQDTAELIVGEGIPLEFSDYRDQTGARHDRGIPTGGFGLSGFRGQIVEHLGGTPEPPDQGPPGAAPARR